MSCVLKNIIGGILDVLHWASWVDYIEYIGLPPHMGTQYGTNPITVTNTHTRTHASETGEELKLTNRSLYGQCALWLEKMTMSACSCKAVSLCADVEVAEREGSIAVVEEAC
jgi:hypothetical protein